jgi:phenylacetate-CoA ligase
MRIAAGNVPRQPDLDEIVNAMRNRLRTGKKFGPPLKLPLPPAFWKQRIRAIQLKKLRNTVAYAREHVPFYQRTLPAAGVRASDIRSLADLRRLPITERADVDGDTASFISRAPGLSPAAMLTPTSGTSGQQVDFFLSQDELERYAALQAIGGMTYGFLGPAHIVQVHFPFEASIAARIYTLSAFKSGALVLNCGLNDSIDSHLESLLKKWDLPGKLPQVRSVFAAPGYLWALSARSLERGLRPEQFGLKACGTGGAKVSPPLKQQVLAAWGVRLSEGYSLAEAVSTGAYACDHGKLHFLDYSGILEILDPVTRQPVQPGTPGVAVFTVLYPDRQLMPLLRYWTRDLVVEAAEPCACGQVTTTLDGVVGRTDHMVTIGGENYYPQPVGDALTPFGELVQPPRFRLRQEDRRDAQYVVIEVECARHLEDPVKIRLAQKILATSPIRDAVHVVSGAVKCEVEFFPAGGIAKPFRYKLQGPTPV